MIKSRKRINTFDVLTVMAIGSLGAFLGALINWHGAGLEIDSWSYFRAARTGVLHDLPVHHAPFYPFILFLFRDLGEIETVAAWVNTISLACSAILICLLLRWVGISRWRLLIASILAVISMPFLEANSFAMSEGLFLFLLLAAVFLFSKAQGNGPLRNLYLFGSACLLALCILTRYAAIGFAAGACLSVFIFPKQNWFKKFLDSLWFGTLVVTPFVFMIIYNHFRSGSFTNRSPTFLVPSHEALHEMLHVVLSWFIPERFLLRLSFGGISLLMTGCCIVLLYCTYEKANARKKYNNTTLLTWLGSYLFFFVFSVVVFDVGVTFGRRYMMPLFPILWLLVSPCLLSEDLLLWKSGWINLKSVVKCVGVIFLVALFSYRAFDYVGNAVKYGKGFSQEKWIYSETLQAVEVLSNEYDIYCNSPVIVWLLSDAKAKGIPWTKNPHDFSPNDEFANEYRSMLNKIIRNGAIVVVFQDVYWPVYLPNLEVILKDSNLPLICTLNDGKIFGTEQTKEHILTLLSRARTE